MTKEDRQTFAKALRTIEKLQFYNFALESLAEKYAPRNWKPLADELANDEQLHPELRDKFRRACEALERDPDPTQKALLDLLLSLPRKGNPN
jgi:hypothetical protein